MADATKKEPAKKKPSEPRLKTTQRKNFSKSPRGKKSKRVLEKPCAKPPQPLEKPPTPKPEAEVKSPHEKTSVPPLLNVEEPAAPKKIKSKINKEISKILKKEDEKYPGINFDVPPPEWCKEDKSKMREILRSMSLAHKKKTNKARVVEIGQQYRNCGPVEILLAREIVGLLQKDTNLMNHMELKHVAFSTFSKNTYEWQKVSDLFDNKHTPAQCKEYWYMDLYPRIKNMGFSEENDKQLMELAIENNFQNWDKIADKLIGHTEYQCYVHFRRNLYKKMLHAKREDSKPTAD